ncbi:MAG: nuclear transport factor 2 family protein [Pseudobdellovibrionaceae bacterium]
MSFKQKITDTFNGFNGLNLDRLDQFYDPKVVFTDPVTQIQGLPNLKKYYTHAYRKVISIRFEFSDILQEGCDYSAPWTMHLAVKGLNAGQEFNVSGLSHLKFNDKGLVVYHRDYVDLGEMVYERLPLLGALIRKLKKLLAR